MANSIKCSEDCERTVTTYPGSGLCNQCYKRIRYHLTKTPAIMAKRRASAQRSAAKRKAADEDAYKAHIRQRNVKRYGITDDDYARQYIRQCGLCALCRKHYDGRLHIDHDHATGKVRGLLCNNCNNGLGRFDDNVEALGNAIAYLNSGGAFHG